MREPLEALSDMALVWIGDLALRGDTRLRAKAPRLVDWLGAEAAREQARRRGEDVPPAPDFRLSKLSPAELLAMGEAATMMAMACRQLGDSGGIGRTTGEQRTPVRRELAAGEVRPVLESIQLWETLSEAARLQLAATLDAPTLH